MPNFHQKIKRQTINGKTRPIQKNKSPETVLKTKEKKNPKESDLLDKAFKTIVFNMLKELKGNTPIIKGNEESYV